MRGLGLSYAARADQHENADWFAGIIQASTRGLDAPRNGIECVSLADDSLLQVIGKIEHSSNFVLHHSTHRNSGPARYYRCDGLFIDARENQGSFPLNRREFPFEIL